MERDWSLWRDSTGKVLQVGSEQEIKVAYLRKEAMEETRGDLFIEDPDGEQFAWNQHTEEWDRL